MPLDLELVKRGFRPEKPSEFEVKCMERVDPVDFSIYTRRLELACYESREILKKLGISTLIQAGDTAHSIYTSNGDLSLAEVGTYMHVVTGSIPIKFVLKHYVDEPTVGVRDGDIFFCNEAIYGGIHNPDMIVFMPVFHKEQLIAWVAAAAHETETGATQPGGMPTFAKSRYDEGLKVPPLKIGENFKLRKDIVELFENSVRYPLMMTNDTAAKVVACTRLRDRLLEIVEKKGWEFVIGLLRKIIESTSSTVKERIRKIPDGTFRCVTFVDTAGSEEGLVRLPLTLVKKGSSMVFDMTHASPQVPGSYNSFQHQVEAVFASLAFQYFLNDVPASAGCLEAFEFRTTHGSLLDANLEAAISNSVYLLPQVINSIQLLLIKALYSSEDFRKDEFLALPLGSAGRGVTLSGRNQWGKNVTNTLVVIGNSKGGGARPNSDGLDSAGFYYSGYATAADCELDESSLPIVTLWRKFSIDGGGPGKFRGGSGGSFGWLVANVDKVSLTTRGSGTRFPHTLGVFGGYPSPTRPLLVFKNGDSNNKEWISKLDQVPDSQLRIIELVRKGELRGELMVGANTNPTMNLSEGDLFAICSANSAGYGDVLDRDPRSVIEDLKLGVVSSWAALNVYKVVYDDKTFEIDYSKTEELRAHEREKRKRQGKPYGEFVKEWEAKRPPADALKHYGEWPIPFSKID